MSRRPLVAVIILVALAALAGPWALAAAAVGGRAIAQRACEPRPVTPIGTGFFTDISVAAGIKPISVTEAFSVHPRIAFADVDGDGWDDIVAHNMSGNVRANRERFDFLVLRNNHDNTFTDISDASGLRHVQASLIAFGDVDNDGDADAFAGLDIQDHPEPGKTHVLLLNDGAGHFSVKPGSGIEIGAGVDEETGKPLYGVGAAVFADLDGDANLDLYLGNGNTGSTGYYMSDQLFLGNGDGTFRDVSERLGGVQPSLSNGAMACDFDTDGDLDVFVSTYGVSGPDHSQKRLWINDGTGHFTNQAVARGVASQAGGNSWRADNDYGRLPEPGGTPGNYIGANGFGVDCPDIDNDGNIDILMATISHPSQFPFPYGNYTREQIDGMNYTRRWSDPSQILVNQGAAGSWAFRNEWQTRGLPYNEGDIDSAAADFDNDGRIDIVMSRDRKYEGSDLNNSVYKQIDQQGWLGLFHQGEDGTFTSVGYTSGLNYPNDPLPQRMRGSGVVNWSDIDHDGDLDLLVGGGPNAPSGHLFRNDIGSQNDWLAVRLVGDGVNVNRDAMGARVTISDGNVTLTREVKGSRGTYNSMDTRVLHFGLGDMTCDYTLTVRWPDGATQAYDGATMGRNRYVTLAYSRVYLPLAVRSAGLDLLAPPRTPVPPTVTPIPTATVVPTNVITVQLGSGMDTVNQRLIGAGTQFQFGIMQLCYLTEWSGVTPGTPLTFRWFINGALEAGLNSTKSMQTAEGRTGDCLVSTNQQTGEHFPIPRGTYRVDVYANADAGGAPASSASAVVSDDVPPGATAIPSATAAVTPTPGPTPAPGTYTCQETLANGDFEQGPTVGWSLASNITLNNVPMTIANVIVSNDVFPMEDPAHQGQWLAFFPGSSGSVGQTFLYQTVQFPQIDPRQVVSATLEYHVGMRSEETPNGVQDDWFTPVVVIPGDTLQYGALQPEGERFSEEHPNEGAYVPFRASVPVSFFDAVAGQAYHFGFMSQNSTEAATVFLLDTTRFEVCTRNAVAPASVAPGPDAGAGRAVFTLQSRQRGGDR